MKEICYLLKSSLNKQKDTILIEQLNIQESSLENLHCMIRDMMDLAKIKNNDFRFDNKKFNFKTLLKSIIEV